VCSKHGEVEGVGSVEIRSLSIEEYDSIIKLWERAGLPSRPKGRDSKRAMERQMVSSPDLLIGAFNQGRLVGIVIGSYDGRMKGWINRLAVDPEWRRMGIAQRLINAVERNLEKLGATIFCALVETPNNESLSLFKKLGYTVHPDILYASKRKNEDA
jgi:ribosomal protein S18 acetylase RimI-like enzyme